MNATLPLFLQGVLHPLMMPLQLLAMLGLGLLLGQQNKPVRLRSLPVAIVTFIAGLFVAQQFHVPATGNLVLLAVALSSGLLSAMQVHLPDQAPPVFAAICGFLVGFMGAPVGQGIMMVGGAAFTGAILLLTVIVFGCLLHRLWAGKGGLILGLSVIAGSLLMVLLPL